MLHNCNAPMLQSVQAGPMPVALCNTLTALPQGATNTHTTPTSNKPRSSILNVLSVQSKVLGAGMIIHERLSPCSVVLCSCNAPRNDDKRSFQLEKGLRKTKCALVMINPPQHAVYYGAFNASWTRLVIRESLSFCSFVRLSLSPWMIDGNAVRPSSHQCTQFYTTS